MLEYALVARIVRRGIYKNKIVWLQDFRAIPRKKKKICTLYKILQNPVISQKSGYLLTAVLTMHGPKFGISIEIIIPQEA